MLTIVSFLWRGWRPLYAAEHVNALRRMLEMHLPIPHRLVCVTDTPQGIECETMPTWKMPPIIVKPRYPDCYRRLWLLSKEARDVFGERLLSIDLDCIILKDMTPLITEDEFRIVDGFSCPYNGSMWLHKTGTRLKAWEQFDPVTSPTLAGEQKLPDGRKYLGSDQAWLSHILPNEPVWKNADGVYLFHGKHKQNLIYPNARIMFFPGHKKPWDQHMAAHFPVIYDAYRRFLK